MRPIEHSFLDQLSRAWHYGNWKSETPAERLMESVMIKLGYWPTTEKDIMERPNSYQEMENFLKSSSIDSIAQAIPIEKTMLRSELQSGDCIAFYIDDDSFLRLGIIDKFITDSKNSKSTVVLVDGRHVPIEKIRQRIKSNEIHLTK